MSAEIAETRVPYEYGDRVKVSMNNAPEMIVQYEIRAGDPAIEATGVEVGVHCFWFSDDGTLQRAVFHPDMLWYIRNMAGTDGPG